MGGGGSLGRFDALIFYYLAVGIYSIGGGGGRLRGRLIGGGGGKLRGGVMVGEGRVSRDGGGGKLKVNVVL